MRAGGAGAGCGVHHGASTWEEMMLSLSFFFLYSHHSHELSM